MQLSTSRCSPRLVFNDSIPDKLQVCNTLWDWFQRIIAWIWSPASYTDENRRTIQCFKKYVEGAIGANRLQRICSRYDLNLNEMEREGRPLLSRDVAKIVVGTKNVEVEDINEFIAREPARFGGARHFQDLDKATLARVESELSFVLDRQWEVAPINGRISGRPTEWLSRFFFDRFLADRERNQLVESHSNLDFDTWVNNMVARVIKREMEVGTLIPAPNHPDGGKQYYYLAAKLVTGHGMVSYTLYPAGNGTNLEPIRLFRGTSPRNSDLAALPGMINDVQRDIGSSAYKSGIVYERIFAEKGLQAPIEAGHSLGSAIVQQRLADERIAHITKAYLYCGPGIPLEKVERFNRKNQNVELFIRVTSTDPWHTFGEAHIGYKAPRDHVGVHFKKYIPPLREYGENPHVAVWGMEPYLYGVEEGLRPDQIDLELYHKDHFNERFRSFFGPPVAKLLKIVRNAVRSITHTRTMNEQGLKIGSIQDGRWRVDHFRPI